MAYFPLFIDITGKPCVVVGGGSVAERKIGQLLEFGAAVTVTASAVTAQIALWQKEKRVLLCLREYRPEDITGAALVVAATDDANLQRQVAAHCRENNIPVNVADVKELCTFFFPAIVKRDDVVVAVSTGGSSPALAARLRRELESVIPYSCGQAAAVMGGYRDYVLTHVAKERQRRQVFQRMLDIIMEGGHLSWDRVQHLCEECTDI